MELEMNDGYSGAAGLQKLKKKATGNLKKKATVAKKAIKKKTVAATKKILPPKPAVKPKPPAARPKPVVPAKPIKKQGMDIGLKIGIGLLIATLLGVGGYFIYKRSKA